VIQENERKETATVVRDVRQEQAMRHIVLGFMWIAGGIGATMFCLGISAAGGSRTYLLATGPFVWGVCQVILGFIRLSQKGPPNEPGPRTEES
jgi:hypothetical protein